MIRKAILAALAVSLSWAANAASERPFNVSVHGNFKQMVHAGDTSGKVALEPPVRAAGTYGVGALAGLRGEILIWDGSVLVTLGESFPGSTQPPRVDDQATLLVTARVKEWEERQVANDLMQQEFERFVIHSARSIGIDPNKPFPFIVIGEVTNYTWHVVSGTSTHPGGRAQHPQGHASSRTFSGAKTEGKLVGFFSAEELEGVLSHPGERFHFHYADNDIKTSGHLDSFGVAKGARLLLPKR